MMKSCCKNSRGFTLVELVGGLAISAIILSGLAATAIQMVKLSPVINNRIAAVRNLDAASTWFMRDFQSTSTSNLPASVVLSPAEDGIPNLTITQSLSAANDTLIEYTIDSNHNLIRNNITSGTAAIVATSISQVQYTTGNNQISITATIGTVTETRSYQVLSRVVS
jgi:prepilin-type N-terminal cleavage/methylation domain-containing protein